MACAAVSRSLRRRRATYWSSVLSCTIAPSGHAARTSSRRRSTAPGWPASAASSRNSVGVSEASPSSSADRVRHRIQAQRADGRRRIGPGAAQQRAQARHDLVEVKRLGHVVVAAGAEAREAVGHGVARGEEEHRGVDAARAQRLAEVAPVGVGQADVDDEPVGRLLGLRHRRGRIGDRDDLEALLAQAARQHQAQLGVVLDDEQSEDRHVDTSMARAT